MGILCLLEYTKSHTDFREKTIKLTTIDPICVEATSFSRSCLISTRETYCCTETSRTPGNVCISIVDKDNYNRVAHWQIKLQPSQKSLFLSEDKLGVTTQTYRKTPRNAI